MNIAYNMDCLEAMKGMKDNEFDLAIVDPPYGVNINTSGTFFKEKYKVKSWDKEPPKQEYFNELFRVSKNQIIWGGNYFFNMLGYCKCFLVWDKKISENMSFAMCEMAWTSFKNGAKIYYETTKQQLRIHPTQKPVALYKWLLTNYAKQGDKILDTHLGSGSSRIACYDLGFDFVGYELDKDYFEAQEKRFTNHINQEALFTPEQINF